MLFDRRGQGYTEYVVLLAGVLLIAVIVIAVILAIGEAYKRQQERINNLP